MGLGDVYKRQFKGCLTESQANEVASALETHKIYREYITDGAVVIILRLKEEKEVIINYPENAQFFKRNSTANL